MKTPRLREWREAMGETQATLGERSGVAEHTISRIEHGASLRPTTARKLADALGVAVADLMERPPVPLADASQETGQVETHHDAALRYDVRRTPELLLEQLHEQGIQTNRSEVSILSQIIGISDELVEEEPIDWQRLGWLLAFAAVSDLFTEDERQAARNPVREELASEAEQLAGYSPPFEDEQTFEVSYADGTHTWGEAWAQATEHAREAKEHGSKATVRDNGEAVQAFVERGVVDRMRAAHERAIRDEVRRADALDRESGSV